MYWILKLGGIIVALASLELIHNATLTKHPTIMALKGLGGVLAFGYGLYLYSSASRREKEEKAREKATQEQSEQLLFSSRTIHALLEQLSTAVITVVVDGHEWQAERLLNGNWREDSLQPANAVPGKLLRMAIKRRSQTTIVAGSKVIVKNGEHPTLDKE